MRYERLHRRCVCQLWGGGVRAVREGASDAASGVDSRQKAGTDLMAGRAALRSVAASMAFDILGMRRLDTKQMVLTSGSLTLSHHRHFH